MGSAATWDHNGVEISAPATVTLTGRARSAGSSQPRVQVCAARAEDGKPAVHLGLFDNPAKQWAEGVASPKEALALAMAILAQVFVAQERWG